MEGGRGVNPLMPFLVLTEEVVGLPAAPDASLMKKKLLPSPLEDESFSSSSTKKRALRLVRVDFGDGLDGDDRRMSKADATGTPMTLMPTMDFPSC